MLGERSRTKHRTHCTPGGGPRGAGVTKRKLLGAIGMLSQITDEGFMAYTCQNSPELRTLNTCSLCADHFSTKLLKESCAAQSLGRRFPGPGACWSHTPRKTGPPSPQALPQGSRPSVTAGLRLPSCVQGPPKMRAVFPETSSKQEEGLLPDESQAAAGFRARPLQVAGALLGGWRDTLQHPSRAPHHCSLLPPLPTVSACWREHCVLAHAVPTATVR